eukprot:scaffold3643_cov132-Skeletonema_menzelii.AAC.10
MMDSRSIDRAGLDVRRLSTRPRTLLGMMFDSSTYSYLSTEKTCFSENCRERKGLMISPKSRSRCDCHEDAHVYHIVSILRENSRNETLMPRIFSHFVGKYKLYLLRGVLTLVLAHGLHKDTLSE